MTMRTARRSRQKGTGAQLPESIRAAASTVREATDVKVDVELSLLDAAEQAEVIAFCKAIRYVQKTEAAPRASRRDVEAFLTAAAKTREKARGPNQRHNLDLLAERARTTGRIPDAEERRVIIDNPDLGATLGTLRLPDLSGGEIVARGFRMNELDETQRARFEALIEKAADAEPGSIFERRRESQRVRTELTRLAALIAPGPRKRRRVDEAGTLVLPMGVWEDLIRSDAEGIWLSAGDLVVLGAVLFMLETRRLPPHQESMGVVRLEDDANALWVRKGVTPWGNLADPEGELGPLFPQSLKRLTHCKWLAVTSDNSGYRITRGPRMLEFLQKREEVI